jgi:hypothetical protein
MTGGRRAAAGSTGVVEQQQPRDVEPQEDHGGQQDRLDAQDGRPPSECQRTDQGEQGDPGNVGGQAQLVRHWEPSCSGRGAFPPEGKPAYRGQSHRPAERDDGERHPPVVSILGVDQGEQAHDTGQGEEQRDPVGTPAVDRAALPLPYAHLHHDQPQPK